MPLPSFAVAPRPGPDTQRRVAIAVELAVVALGIALGPFLAKTAKCADASPGCTEFAGFGGPIRAFYSLGFHEDFWISVEFHLWVARLVALLTLPDRLYRSAVTVVVYAMRTVPYAYHLALGPGHKPSAMMMNMMLGGQVPGVIFLFLTMQRTSAVFELAFALLGTPAALVLAKWYARHDTHSASLSGLSAWCQLLQCLVVALVNLSIHFRAARHQRRLHQRPRQQHQHPDSQGLKPPLRRRGPAPPPGHSAADAGGSVQAGDGSSSSGLSPAGRRKELAAPVMVTATAAHSAASAAAAAAAPESAAAAHCFDKAAPAAAPAAPAAAAGSPEASAAAVQRLQQRQPPPMQPLEAAVPATAAAAPAAAQQGPAVLAAA